MSVPVTLRLRPLVRERERDRAGSRPEVDDFHGSIARRKRERQFHQSLRFRPRDQHVGRHAQHESPELANARELRDRLAVAAAFGEREERTRGLGRQRIGAVRGKPRARHVEDVGEQDLRVDRNEAADDHRAAHRDGVGHG